jgi:hypothetical protein
MGVARCMAYSHWVSDVVGGIILSWILMHLVYYHLLDIPRQESDYMAFGRHPERPAVWELVLCLYLGGVVVGLMGVVLGLRSFFLSAPMPLMLLAPLGGLLSWYCGRLAVRLRKKALNLTGSPHSP